MKTSNSTAASEFDYSFDAWPDAVVFGGELNLSGWLVHREDKPIHGIRVIIRRPPLRSRRQAARRKRRRPEVAAAFPDLATAWSSGFLFELRLRLGRNRLTFQVQDHTRRWRTFHEQSVVSVPLKLLTPLPRTKQHVARRLQRRFARRHLTNSEPAGVLPVSHAGETLERVELFATSKSNLFMLEIGELVAAGFRELGYTAQLHIDAIRETEPEAGVLQMIVAPHEFHILFLQKHLAPARMIALTRQFHLLCTEQPETGWFEHSLQWARQAAGVADINPLGVAAFRARGVQALPLGLGHHAMLEDAGSDRPHAEREHDLTFLGAMTPRREFHLAQHADLFARHSCHLRLVPLGFAKTKETKSYLSAERRNALLSHSRLLLNLHHSEQRYFEWHRVLVALANGCCVITEPAAGYGMLVPGRHFVMVETEDLRAACEYFLAHPEEAERIARAGQKFVRAEMRQAQSCAAFLEQWRNPGHGLRAASLAPDHPPEPLPVELGRAVSRQHRALGRALRADLQNLFRSSPEEPRRLSAPEREMRRAEVVQRRAAFAERFRNQEETIARGAAAWDLQENAAYHDATAPQLGILITLYNYFAHIEECVASITVAAAQLEAPPEIVIVNDASTDASHARALHFMNQSSLPVRVVDKKFNTGLADARNVGIRLSRAPYLFMMDADNLIFPAALRVLLATITRQNAAAAYSILCRFRDKPSQRVGLLSQFDFDPQVLAQEPYVDAMALFRREVLLRHGGYDNELNQIGWFGWEDYDLWLRFVRAGESVAFVPNILCQYRYHDTSMINTTRLFGVELAQHFIERYGEILKPFEARPTIFGVQREKLAAEQKARS